ncbi:hypothetical protein CVD25_15370 [Bacillus canaveralius]|uniref:Uncharacterized protein n=1 Tax=Bacillus canaveralius TaxID=1403243 RepID=A0A2N5GK96_9BACI|nr:hypothetical protein CU635_13895 [Bacillus canaveralius]PLR95001.1 hypothetical protein CVD25_15370 [Bacillus canaveralius]
MIFRNNQSGSSNFSCFVQNSLHIISLLILKNPSLGSFQELFSFSLLFTNLLRSFQSAWEQKISLDLEGRENGPRTVQLSADVLRYEPLIRKYAEQNGIGEYIGLIMPSFNKSRVEDI